ncbi:helix-turn-helix transcriptional regulator [Clostridium botulinum]|uniref:helix-turn-helix domain-containing protein n=1 Tax=Clostridium botulinum TaxID=1491 RepID=UPI00058607FD|nr:helix-turn-helix transcriptional regulator [Clostridium botulinum]AJD26305.1 helix-turn-helix family protein [Clostridium botulinum CDC_297]MBY6877729.1 helix-turn-helix transcriptional regulator [Clostridium botulinum]MBY6891994.1 helix-turn-helix transcriptional regulator [Clostridium botulinum]MBY6894428.1 helix-turn-helix transcriptional regulator [Clostridium botulinum]MBY6901680.1 helix-turn-helix transcriptional regulator [Clostridium botulinum]
MININFIGNRIYQLRKQSNLTMKEFAELTGCSAGYISDIEHSKNIPSIPKLIEICGSLNLSLSDFFNTESSSQPLTPELKELLDHAKNLTPEQLEQLTKFIKTLK